MSFLEITGLTGLEEQLQEFSEQLILLFFYSDGLAECAQVGDVLQELLNTAGDKATALKINSSKDELCKKYEVSSVPTVKFILDEEVVDTLVGADVPALSKKFAEHLKAKEEKKNTRLRELINKAPVMLFMKGNPSAPRCGFSKQVIALLNSHNAKYETFDILEDYEVREGLKVFSNWPTYPQLYVKGELIGGLDIMKELSSSGELDSILTV